jgi:hypothetical protein
MLRASILTALIGVLPAAAQGTEQISVPLSDPTRPGTLNVHTLQGGLTITGTEGREVVVVAEGGGRAGKADLPPGMRRIGGGPMGGVEVTEKDNVVTVRGALDSRSLSIRVPAHMLLRLRTVAGSVTVQDAQGEMEIQSVNGAIRLVNVRGSAVANTVNGTLSATFASVEGAKAMSFSTLNGVIDLAFPASLKANLRLEVRGNGGLACEFPVATPAVGDGMRSLKPSRVMQGPVNGGGPEIRVSTFNGGITVRKR